jgi:hypothetical protein
MAVTAGRVAWETNHPAIFLVLMRGKYTNVAGVTVDTG